MNQRQAAVTLVHQQFRSSVVPSVTRGKFITFEGGDGSGKSTQAVRLAQALEAHGIQVLMTREPGGTPFAELVRNLILSTSTSPPPPLAEALIFSAARVDHLDRVIRPALERGVWVICDRFFDSTRVYQGAGGGVETPILDELEIMVVGPTRPDLTLILDIDPAEGLKRAIARRFAADLRNPSAPPSVKEPADYYEQRDLSFHQRLREGFLKLANDDPERCVLIDATKSLDEIALTIWHAAATRLIDDRP